MVVAEFKSRLSDLLKECFDFSPENRSRVVDKIIELINAESTVKPRFTIAASDDIDENAATTNGEASIQDAADESRRLKDYRANFSTPTLKASEIEETRLLDELVRGGKSHRMLEQKLAPSEAVRVRRKYIERVGDVNMIGIPHASYDYKEVNGACCENLIGYMPLPVGVVGPLKIDNDEIYVPMATTEGALVASTNRGCKALATNGVRTIIENDAMTRAPVLRFESIHDALKFAQWLEKEENFKLVKAEFESTSRYCKLKGISTYQEGDDLHLRFVASTGDAMGMNMVTKATQAAIDYLNKEHKFRALSLSGNMCTDKKAAAINWICGRGRSTVAEAIVSASVVRSVLKSSVDSLVRLADAKCGRGSANAITIGGANAQAANVVAAIFIATGQVCESPVRLLTDLNVCASLQDAAQVVSSSMCSTRVEATEAGDLRITCTMKCVEVGTVGGGTILEPQRAALRMLGCAGAHAETPGENARRLARIVCATVLAGELSLLSSQCAGDLVRSHMRLNRSSRDFNPPATSPQKLARQASSLTRLSLNREDFAGLYANSQICSPL